VDTLWCQGAQNIGLFDGELKSALNCTVWSQCKPVPDRQMNIMAIARRFVLTNASRAKNQTTINESMHGWWSVALWRTLPRLCGDCEQLSMKADAMTAKQQSTESDLRTSKINWGFCITFTQNRNGKLHTPYTQTRRHSMRVLFYWHVLWMTQIL